MILALIFFENRFKFFLFLYFAFPCAHIGPHTLCEQVLDHVINPRLSELACGPQSVPSIPLGACFSLCSAALQWRQRRFHLPGSLRSGRAYTVPCQPGRPSSLVKPLFAAEVLVICVCIADPPPHTHIQAQLVESSLISRPQPHIKMSQIKPWISLCPDFILIAD